MTQKQHDLEAENSEKPPARKRIRDNHNELERVRRNHQKAQRCRCATRDGCRGQGQATNLVCD